MPGGRPTSYSEEMLKKTWEYISDCEDDEVQQTIGMSAKGTELFKNKVIVNIPTVEGLALYLGVNKTTLYEWESKHEEFSNALGKLKAKQAKQLINKGLSGDYNPTIAKLILSSNHGYKEKSETDITTKGEKMIATDELIALANRLNDITRNNIRQSVPSDGVNTHAVDEEVQD